MVEVFKTNVQEIPHAERLVIILQQHFPDSKINFDLDDCDRVLRIEGSPVSNEKVTQLLHMQDYICVVME